MEYNIVNKILKYLDETKDEEIELKPTDFSSNISNIENFKIDRSSSILDEQKIICNNIIQKFLSLNNEKFLACLKKIYEWDFETCMKEFIIHYYLYIKNDNLLRQYIIIHLDTLINLLKDKLKLKLLKYMKNFNFENSYDENEIQTLKNNLANKKSLMLKIDTKSFNEDESENIVDDVKITNVNQKNALKTDILNQLKQENKLLEEIL